MATSAPPEPAFEVPPHVDITRLPLAPAEGMAVARVLGRRVTLRELVAEGVIPAAGAEAFIGRLISLGALVRVAAVTTGARSHPGYPGVVFSAADLSEAVDLTDDQKRRILFVEMNLATWDHYKLLGLTGKATPADIKAAYFRVSKEFHPDTYFRKRLGSYQQRLERVFRAIKAAADELSDPARRVAYDARTAIDPTAEDEAAAAGVDDAAVQERLRQDREARNAERVREQRIKRNPAVERLKRARELLEKAERAKQAGKHNEAATHARLAATYDPSLMAQAGGYIRDAERLRGIVLVRKLELYLGSALGGDEYRDAVERMLEEAAELATSTRDAGLALSVSRFFLRQGRLTRAAKLALLATELDARNPRAWEQLAEVAAADKKWAITSKAAERWLALEPEAARGLDLQREARLHVSDRNS